MQEILALTGWLIVIAYVFGGLIYIWVGYYRIWRTDRRISAGLSEISAGLSEQVEWYEKIHNARLKIAFQEYERVVGSPHPAIADPANLTRRS